MKLPENRYKTAVEMREDLRSVLRENVQQTLRFVSQQIPPTAPSPKLVGPISINPNPMAVGGAAKINDPEGMAHLAESPQNKSKTLIYFFISVIVIGLIIGSVGLLIFKTTKNTNVSNLSQPNTTTNSSNINVSVNASKEASNKTENMREQLKMSLNKYLADLAKAIEKSNGTKEKGRAVVEKSYYKDVDNDGLEDAVFLFKNYVENTDYVVDGFVVFRNNGSQYAFAGDYAFIDGEEVTIQKFNVNNGFIFAQVAVIKEEGADPVIKNHTFIVEDNRIREK